MLLIYEEPEFSRITMIFRFKVVVMNTLLQVVWGLPLVLRICGSWWRSERLLAGDSCGWTRFHTVLLCKPSLVRSVPSLQLLCSVFLLLLQFRLLILFVTLHGQFKIMWMNRHHIVVPFLHWCSMGNGTSCHQRFCSRVCCQRARAVVRRVYSGILLQFWLVLC